MTPPSKGWRAYWEFFRRGLRDSLSFPKAFTLIYSSSAVQQAYLYGLIINVATLFGSTFILKYFKSYFGIGFLMPVYTMLPHLLFFFSLFVSSNYYQKISWRVYQKKEGSSTRSANMPALPLADKFAEALYRFLFISFHMGLIVVLSYFGPLISYMPSAWIMAFYCFEFKWTDSKWKFKQQIEYFEDHWVYFAGFGFPLALINNFVLWDGFPVILILFFPCFIVLATIATPVPRHKQEADARGVLRHFPVFYFSRVISEKLLSVM